MRFFLFSILNISIIRRYFYFSELEIARERKEIQRKKLLPTFLEAFLCFLSLDYYFKPPGLVIKVDPVQWSWLITS